MQKQDGGWKEGRNGRRKEGSKEGKKKEKRRKENMRTYEADE